MSKVKANIEIEDTYSQAIMDRYGVHTKTEAVDLALRHLAGQPMTRDEALAMRGAHAIDEIPDDIAPTSAACSSSTHRPGWSTTGLPVAQSTNASPSSSATTTTRSPSPNQ